LDTFAEQFLSKAMRYSCTGRTQKSSNGRLISTPKEQKERKKERKEERKKEERNKKVKNVRSNVEEQADDFFDI